MSIRDNIARSMAGGPEFRPEPNRILVEVNGQKNLTEAANELTEERTESYVEPIVENGEMRRVGIKLEDLGFQVKELENFGTLVATTERLNDVFQNIINAKNTFNDKAVSRLEKAREKAKNGGGSTILGGFRPGMFNFEDSEEASMEAKLRNELTDVSLKNELTDAIEDIDGVFNAELSYTRNTFGPRNLGVDVDNVPTIRGVLEEGDEESNGKPDVGDAIEKMGVKDAWDTTRGEGAVIAVFDTSFCADYLDSDRVLDTFSGDDVESAFSTPSEGHGTMTAYSSGGNKEESGLPYDGVAPEADLLLARTTDSSGGLVYTEEAWNWLADWIRNLDRPVISNHSYGIPMCAARPMDSCSTTTTKIAEVMNQRDDHQAFYAAGNEAIYCGHRLSGVTNGINSINSSNTSITVGALRFDLADAQNYSSHGYGTCSDAQVNPKPDVSCLLPSILPYGCKEKDMSSGNGGSSGGTSEATPLTAGVAALMASVSGTAKRSSIEGILEATAKLPRTTQVNVFRGHDARFGHGQVRADAAVEQAELISAGEPPNASFTTSPNNPEVGQEVTLNATASSDPDSEISGYTWDFGDGQTGSGERVTHSYDSGGEYRVVLTVTDEFGNEDTATQTVNVTEEPEDEESEGSDEEGGNAETESFSGPFGLIGN